MIIENPNEIERKPRAKGAFTGNLRRSLSLLFNTQVNKRSPVQLTTSRINVHKPFFFFFFHLFRIKVEVNFVIKNCDEIFLNIVKAK